ncbi:hypothetical protein BT96DRAFT_259497 [Gymnopus androsaceus JB14]|uniref:Uncharacterized protein n=1 Tax=Gymnopus androsaceus JB14 TaxID=1447944 RepID=A0A6A4H6R2_9AGAR|nr:hypothetical protein BT96DRAFT_259497 [Gymnopus androsaceus JB14]
MMSLGYNTMQKQIGAIGAQLRRSLPPSHQLRACIFALFEALDQNDLGDASRLSLQLYSSPESRSSLDEYLGRDASKFMKHVNLLARVARAQVTFLEIVHELPSFSRIEVICVHKQRNDNKRKAHTPFNLSKIFRLLQQPLTEQTCRQFVNPKLNIARIEEDFIVRQKQGLHVHAEVQIIQHLAQARIAIDSADIFPYIGCSKLSCYMCQLFLDAYSSFKIRGCHGKLYNQWIIPDMVNIHPDTAEKLRQTVEMLQQHLLVELGKPLLWSYGPHA